MTNRYDTYYSDPRTWRWILERSLKNNTRSLEQWTWGDYRWDGPSRLADYLVNLAFRSGKAYPKYETMAYRLNTDVPTIRRWLRKVVTVWGFFEPMEGGGWRPRYQTTDGIKETHKAFKKRVLKRIQADVAVRRILRDLTETAEKWYDGKVHHVPRKMAPHSNEEFVKHTGRSRPTITRCLLAAEDEGYTVRFAGNGKGRKSLYVRPDDEERINQLEGSYPRHEPKQGADKIRHDLVAVDQALIDTIRRMNEGPPVNKTTGDARAKMEVK